MERAAGGDSGRPSRAVGIRQGLRLQLQPSYRRCQCRGRSALADYLDFSISLDDVEAPASPDPEALYAQALPAASALAARNRWLAVEDSFAGLPQSAGRRRRAGDGFLFLRPGWGRHRGGRPCHHGTCAKVRDLIDEETIPALRAYY